MTRCVAVDPCSLENFSARQLKLARDGWEFQWCLVRVIPPKWARQAGVVWLLKWTNLQLQLGQLLGSEGHCFPVQGACLVVSRKSGGYGAELLYFFHPGGCYRHFYGYPSSRIPWCQARRYSLSHWLSVGGLFRLPYSVNNRPGYSSEFCTP